jgi:hypothetical protein
MWETIKNAVTSAKEALGIEIPGLPVDLGAIGETVTGAVAGATESATGALDGVAAAGEAAAGDVAQTVSGLPTAAVDAATQARA